MKRRPHPDRDLGGRDPQCGARGAEGQRLLGVRGKGAPPVRARDGQARLVLGAVRDWREGLEGAVA